MTDASIKVDTLGYTAKIPVPTLEDVEGMFTIPSAYVPLPPEADKEVVAMATAVYEAVRPSVLDCHRHLAAQMARDMAPGNLWFLPARPRLPYPYAPFYAVASMIQTEKATGRKADWLLWTDDDVMFGPELYRQLRAAADPVERPFMCAAGIDRFPPFRVAVWQRFTNDNGLIYRKQWVAPGGEGDPHVLLPGEMWAPREGVHQVETTGLCAALFHRSLFDKIAQPWFAVIPGETNEEGKISHKINTDGWWCQRLEDKGIPRYVNCDVRLVHLGFPIPASMGNAPLMRQVFRTAGVEPT